MTGQSQKKGMMIVSLVKIIVKCIHYLQWDKRWKNIKYSTHTSAQTIGNSGCGTTAMAMIVAQFCDPSITPVETSKLAVEHGYRTYDSGTAWGFFRWCSKHWKFGGYEETKDINVLKKAFDEGALAVGSMNSNDGCFWTKGGHFITIIGYDSDGYIYANDPNKSSAPRKQKQDKFKSCLKKAFIFWPHKETTPDIPTGRRQATETQEPQKIWSYLMEQIGNAFGVAGLMGNLKAESNLRSCNLQQSYETKLGYTDTTYTQAVDAGTYKNFSSDSAGYGLAQWTSGGRKLNLLNYALNTNSSIGNLDMQLEFLMKELTGNYKSVLEVLKNAKSVREASDAVLLKFEIPKDRSESVQIKRAGYGEEFYKKYSGAVPADDVLLKKGSKGEAVEELQRMLIEAGYGDILQPYGVDGDYGKRTEKAVKQLQIDNGLAGSGKYDTKTQQILMALTGQRVVVVTGGRVNTRLCPVDGKVYKVVKKGDRLPYVDTDAETGWYLVMVDGVQVWITPKYSTVERM